MQIKQLPGDVLNVRLSAEDTHAWATRPGAAWPCSELRGRRMFAQFDGNGDLIDLCIDGGRWDQECCSNEFSACLTDHIASRFPDHPALRGEPQPI